MDYGEFITPLQARLWAGDLSMKLFWAGTVQRILEGPAEDEKDPEIFAENLQDIYLNGRCFQG